MRELFNSLSYCEMVIHPNLEVLVIGSGEEKAYTEWHINSVYL